MEQLLAISPIDGRYNSKTNVIQKYFSEYGLNKYRIKTELHYFSFLTTLNIELSNYMNHDLDTLINNMINILKS